MPTDIFGILEDYQPGEILRNRFKKGDLTVLNSSGLTPLMVAAKSDNSRALAELIDRRVPLDTRTKGVPGGKSALRFAVEEGNLNATRALLEAGANPDTKDSEGWTPLLVAVEGGKAELVDVLISKGADPNRSNTPMTPLTVACSKRDPFIVERLLKLGAAVNLEDQGGSFALLQAASTGNSEVVQILISHGADVNQVDYQGMSALMAAVLGRNEKVFEVLLAAGADLGIKNEMGESALDVAKRLNSAPEIIELLQR